MMSAPKREGDKKCHKFAVNQYKNCAGKRGRWSKNPKFSWPSYMEAGMGKITCKMI